MRYFILLLIAGVVFSGCDPIVKEGVVPGETFSLEKLYNDVKKIDTSAAMIGFQPDSGTFKHTWIFLDEFFPDRVFGLKGNVLSMVETELSPQERGRIEEDYTKEYFFENGRPVKIINNDPDGSYVQTLTYDANGLLVTNKIDNEEEDSTVLEYQYDTQNKLTKILHFDGVNKLVKTTHVYYHKDGRLDSVLHEDSEGEDYTYKYFINSRSNSLLKVRLTGRQTISWAVFYKLNDSGEPDYDEQYEKGTGYNFRTNKYTYNEHGDLTKTEINFPIQYKLKLTQSYPKRDTAGSWTEMFSYNNGDLFGVTRRKITYK